MAWPTNRTEFGPNRTPVLVGLGYQDETSIVPVAVDETTGYLLVSASLTPSGTQDVNLKEVGGSTIALGQTTAANSLPVVLDSNYDSTVLVRSGNPTGSAVPSNAYYMAGNYSGDLKGLTLDSSGNLSVNLNAGSNTIGAISNTSFAATQSGSWNVGTKLATQVTGQTTSSTSAVQLSSTSHAATNGIIVQAISTNSASVFIGVSGVTTSTGFELQAGQAIATSATNINVLYVIGSNTSDKVCWIVT